MTAQYDPEIRATIDAAFTNAEAGRTAIALQTFALARSQALNLADPKRLSAAIARDQAAYMREREMYRALLKPTEDAKKHVVIAADSLGLPRPDDKVDSEQAAKRTYSHLIDVKYPERSVTSICQRFFTTTGVKNLLTDDADLGRGSDFILHVGLNDCANRMFLEPERISLSLLSKETRERMVEFTRLYRRDILQGLPPHHYTPLAAFRSNLDAIVGLLRERNAGRIILTTIILPPARSWPGTPGMNKNFAAYNLEIMDAVYRHAIDLLDFDRHIWQAQNQKVLLPDGMHLSDLGHQLFTAKCDPYLR